MTTPSFSRLLPRRAVPALLLALCSFGASAHVGLDAGNHHGFLTGLLHPMGGLDHLAAMLAVGLWSATSTRRCWVAPLSFALTLLAGALLAQAGIALPGVEPMIAASLLVIGLLLAARARLSAAAGAALVGGFALFHGAAHGQELNGSAALLGMVLGTALLHGVGLVMGLALRERAALLPRLIGSTVALAGTAMGWSLVAA